MKTFQTLRVVVALSFFSVVSGAFAAPLDIPQSKQVATAWLAKLDADDFTECWNLLASDSKSRISRWRWNLQCRMGRLALGKATSRKLKSAEPDTKTPGGRPGQFLIVRFETQPEKGGPVIELVAIEADHDGQLRVGGYGVAKEDPTNR
ncbi:MAG: DUF4019 domain-containing protein [Chthoniobacterales bacterium]